MRKEQAMRTRGFFTICAAVAALSTPALAQVPVIDAAALTQAQQTASNTRELMATNTQILEQVQKTLQAVTGQRSSESNQLGSLAVGGFSLGQAPSLGDILKGGQMSWAGLGSQAQSTASTLINGLQLVKSLSGLASGKNHATDQAYTTAVNSLTALTGIVSATQGAVTQRSQAFQGAAGRI